MSVDELEDLGSGVFGADADVVQLAVQPEAEFAVEVDLVGQYPVVDVGAAVTTSRAFDMPGGSRQV